MTTSEPAVVRRSPCPSCPFRQSCPSGVWHENEYEKLRKYDSVTSEQPTKAFYCHNTPKRLCSGWVGFRKYPEDLLAIRIGIANGQIDPIVLGYKTTVLLFPTGAAAAEHGERDIDNPSIEAIRAINKIKSVRNDLTS